MTEKNLGRLRKRLYKEFDAVKKKWNIGLAQSSNI